MWFVHLVMGVPGKLELPDTFRVSRPALQVSSSSRHNFCYHKFIFFSPIVIKHISFSSIGNLNLSFSPIGIINLSVFTHCHHTYIFCHPSRSLCHASTLAMPRENASQIFQHCLAHLSIIEGELLWTTYIYLYIEGELYMHLSI